jgi:hypothetical protein
MAPNAYGMSVNTSTFVPPGQAFVLNQTWTTATTMPNAIVAHPSVISATGIAAAPPETDEEWLDRELEAVLA